MTPREPLSEKEREEMNAAFNRWHREEDCWPPAFIAGFIAGRHPVEHDGEAQGRKVCKCGHTGHWHAAVVLDGPGDPREVPPGTGCCEQHSEDGSPCGCEWFTAPVEHDEEREDARVTVGLSRIGPHGGKVHRRHGPVDDADAEAVNAAYDVMLNDTRLPDDFEAARKMAMAVLAVRGHVEGETEQLREALEKIADAKRKNPAPGYEHTPLVGAEMRRIARAALSRGEDR